MKIWWVISLILCHFKQYSCWNRIGYYFPSTDLSIYPWITKYHYPGRFTTTMTPYINGTEERIPSTWDTPDFRIAEPHFVPMSTGYVEHDRPYVNSPAYRNFQYYWGRGYTGQSYLMYYMGCCCNTVYRRVILVAGCAVITTRHVVTSATPTALILRSYKHVNNLDNIFGGWYDTTTYAYNSSVYFAPSRIHFHPEYTYPHEVNISHPIPAMYDLAIIASQVTFYSVGLAKVMVCNRAGSGRFEYTSTIPWWNDVSLLGGFQFIKSYNRNPVPWFRYIVHTKQHLWPCPKSDWHWFHCIMGEYWGKFGFDSGGMMGTAYNSNWRWDGLAGVGAFSLKLRSKQTVHYFTVVDTWPVLDFMYDAFLGLSKCVWLDNRFEDTKWGAPVLYWGERVNHYNYVGVEYYYSMYYRPFY